MKRGNWSAVLAALSILIGLAGCTADSVGQNPPPAVRSADDTDWLTAASEGELVLESGDIRLCFDTSTTHFTVENRAEGVQFASFFDEEPVNMYSADTKERMRSELTLTYYEEQSAARHMFSTADSVALGTYRITHTDSRIRVYYTFGATEDSLFIPYVFSESKFNEITEELLNGENPDGPDIVRRLTRFFTLFTADTADNDIRRQYPVIDSHNLYILNDAASETDIDEVKEYMAMLRYDRDAYEADLVAIGLSLGEAADAPGFVVPIEYSVNPDGFSACVLTDRIEEISPTYKLQSLSFLEYFFSSEDSDGQFFVPDGSGALIDWDANHVSAYSQAFYGSDYSVQNNKQTQLSQTICLPVYGVSRPSGGAMVIVEEGAENGTLHADSPDCSATPNHAYTQFTMRHMDATDIGADQLIPVYNLFAKDLTSALPTQRYVLLGAGRSDWQQMASRYRRYLLDTGGIRSGDPLDASVYLTYLGMFIRGANVLGIPYDKKVVLSTVEDIRRDLDRLAENGVENAVVRLQGISSRGLTPKANNRFELYGGIGSVSELQSLQEGLNERGGRLYLDGDFTFAYSAGNGFSKKTDSAHYLNRVLVRQGNYNLVTREYQPDVIPRYLVSPKRYADYAGGYLADATRRLGDSPSVSYGSAGRYLGGDYTSNLLTDRSAALSYLRDALDIARGQAAQLCFDNGNGYVLPYAADLYNVPLSSSDFDAETSCVPFMPMVLHGIVPYAGLPLNLSYDKNEYLLRSIEYGAAPSYTVITHDDELLIGTDLISVYYSLNSGGHLDDFLALWKRIGDFQRAVGAIAMTAHRQITDTVFCTTYENGCQAYVNYGESDYTDGLLTVKARDFTLVTG